MKKIITLLSLLFVMLPTFAMAHTGLSQSNPTEGQIITEELKQIELTYQGHIEELSKMVLEKDGKEINFTEIKQESTKMTGLLSEPLENGNYAVNWTVIGEDGHPVEGKISFTVQREVIEEKIEKETPVTEEKKEVSKEKEVTVNTNGEEHEEEHSSNFKTISLVVIAVLVIGIVLTLFTKAKK